MTAPRHAGIIAAGDGTRLKPGHPALVKPLVPVAGVPLCHWVVGSFWRAGIQDFTVILNTRGGAVSESLLSAFPKASWDFRVADTASSWESFRLVARALSKRTGNFLMSTVDSLISPEDVARFAREMGSRDAPAGLALTSFVDDEKPLWADLGPEGLVRALGPQARSSRHVTAGLYYLTRDLAQKMPEASAHRSLRQYWTSLVATGLPVAGVVLTKTLDVDRPEDLLEAEGFVRALSS